MADVLRLRLSPAQRALARFRDEERAFRAVLRILKETRREELFEKLLCVYRARTRRRGKLAGETADVTEPRSADEDLARFSRDRDP